MISNMFSGGKLDANKSSELIIKCLQNRELIKLNNNKTRTCTSCAFTSR